MAASGQRHATLGAPPSGRAPLALAALAVFLVAAGLYARALGHGFVWDDVSIVMADDSLADWSRLGANLAPGFFHEADDGELRDYWRPVVVLSHMIDRQLFGDAARGPHLVNVLLHALTSVLVLCLAHAWFAHAGRAGLGPALVAALLFAVHPVHVEVVAWVSGRSDLLVGLFLTLALWADARYARSGRSPWLALGLGAFALALLSKEVAVVFPALVLARAVAWPPAPAAGGRSASRTLVPTLAALGVLALVVWVRFALLAASPPGVTAAADRGTLFWTWWSAFGLYLELLAWPAHLTILHHVDVVRGLASPRVVAGLLACLALAWGAWRSRRREPALAFGLAVLLLGLAPLSNFLVPVSRQAGAAFPVAERFLYAPSVGFCLAVAWVLARWLPRRLGRLGVPAADPTAPAGRAVAPGELAAGALVLLALAGAGWRAHARVGDWSSDLTLFATAVRDAPGSYLAHLDYAAALATAAEREADPEARRASLEEARLHYLEAARLAPGNYRVHFDFGNLEQALGRHAEAAAAYRRALELHPDLYPARINLGALLARQGNLAGALAQFAAAERLRPQLAAPKVNRAHVLQMLGRPADAIALYEAALELDPGLVAARDGLRRARQAVAAGEDD